MTSRSCAGFGAALFVAVFSLLILYALPAPARAQTSLACPFTWMRNLKVGSTGMDVQKLQQFLNAASDTTVATAGAGSAGHESTTFGPATKKAVIKFQEKYAADILVPNGLAMGTGMAGSATRAKLNALCAVAPASESPASSGTVTMNTMIVSTDALTVSDPGQPPTSIAPAGSAPLFFTFTLIAGDKDVVVSAVTVERTGLGNDGAFSSFGLWDEQGLQIGPIATLNSQHQIVFRRPFTVRAGTSQTLTIYASMNADLTDYVGQAPALRLSAISASSPVEGTIPLQGNVQSINNSLVVGGATAILSPNDPGTAITRYIGDTNVKFAGIRITANSEEDLTLSNIIWTQSGTVGTNDIANLATVVDGVPHSMTVSPYSDKDYVATFDPAIPIKKGNAIDVYIKGDVLPSGVNRTVEFDIRDINSAVGLTGNAYGFAVGLSAGGNTGVTGDHSAFITSTGDTDGDPGIPFFAGSVVTINGASVTSVEKAN